MENGSFRLVSNFVLTLVQVWKNWCILRLKFVSFFFYFFSPLFLAFKFLKLNWNAYTCVRSILKQKHSNLFFWVLRLPRLTMPLRFVQDNAAHTESGISAWNENSVSKVWHTEDSKSLAVKMTDNSFANIVWKDAIFAWVLDVILLPSSSSLVHLYISTFVSFYWSLVGCVDCLTRGRLQQPLV